MRIAVRAAFLAAACFLLLAAKGAKPQVEFTHENYFRFGMSLADAENALKQSKDFKIAYRVDTTQTSDLACVYQGAVYYRLSFYQGRCYSMEKRAELPQDQVDTIFEYFKGKLGATPEATRSQDMSLMYARWKFKDRDISLTGSVRSSGLYMITYEEVDNETAGEAKRVQEDELQSMPQETDPLTGKPRQMRTGAQPGDGGQLEPQDNGAGAGDVAPQDTGKEDAKEKAAREKAARERAAKEQAAKERAAKEQAALEKAKEKAKSKEQAKDDEQGKDPAKKKDDSGKKEPEKPKDPKDPGGVEMD